MKGLEYLSLYRTKVTNAGLDRLKPLTWLREIDLRYTQVSRGGIEALRAALPAASVVFIDSSPVSAGAPVPPPSDIGDESIAKWVRALGGIAVVENGALVPSPSRRRKLAMRVSRICGDLRICRSWTFPLRRLATWDCGIYPA
jgi:hypothetical protein